MPRFHSHRPLPLIRAAKIIAISTEDGIPWLTLDGATVTPGSPARLESTAEWVEQNGAEVGGWVVDIDETTVGYLPGNIFAATMDSQPPTTGQVAAAQTLDLLAATLGQLAEIANPS